MKKLPKVGEWYQYGDLSSSRTDIVVVDNVYPKVDGEIEYSLVFYDGEGIQTSEKGRIHDMDIFLTCFRKLEGEELALFLLKKEYQDGT